MNKPTLDEIAADLLFPLFRSISEEYKVRYKRTIWEQFESWVRSSTYTASLSGFYSKFCAKAQVQLQAQYHERVKNMLQNDAQEEILEILRNETATLTVLVRLLNQERKESYAN